MHFYQINSYFFTSGTKTVRLVFLLFFFSTLSVSAQKYYSLEIQSINNANLLNKIPYKKQFLSSSDRDKELQKMLLACYDNAYLVAS
ncbi:MAG: hypothetical protein NTX97_11245, partial [Bacteroidetes bacterium]|nr:hypothetical protein [Bacteroidota bacterium]